MQTKLSHLILMLLLCLPLSACASQPVAMIDLPVFPGAEPLEPDEYSLAGKVLEAMQTSAEEQALSAKFDFYTLPDGTTWEEIVAFYQGELAGTDWTPAPELDSESDTFKGVGWSRVDGDVEQSLVVNYVPRVLTEGEFLLVGLLTK